MGWVWDLNCNIRLLVIIENLILKFNLEIKILKRKRAEILRISNRENGESENLIFQIMYSYK